MRTPAARRFLSPFLLASAILVSSACAPRGALEPAPAATEAPGLEEAARSTVDGVRMVGQVDEWPGPQPIMREVTPVRVVVENNSGQPLRIAYDAFALVSPEGRRFAALPPYGIEGSVEEPVTVDTYAPIANPGFAYTGFEVAPYYGSIYPGLSPYAGPFGYDPYYYDNYYTYWRDIDLPTEEMLDVALPEGVVNTGGRLEGYLYFEDVPADLDRVVFRADLINAQTSNVFGEIRIPYTVEG